MSRRIASISTTLAVATAAVVVLAVLAFARPAGGATSPASQRDPLAAPAAVAFRQAEHASAVDGRDALAAPGLAAFRQSEHASVTTVSFADSERADNYGTQWSKDPLAAPNIVSFRQSEHAEAGR